MSFIKNNFMYHLQRIQAGAVLLVTGISIYLLTTADLLVVNVELARMMEGVNYWLSNIYVQS